MPGPYTLTGEGVQTIGAVGALKVHVNSKAAGFGMGSANPHNWYHVGLLRLGSADGYYAPQPIDADDQVLALPGNVDRFGYALPDGTEIVVTELAIDSPWRGPPGAAGAAGAAGAPGTAAPIGHLLLAASTVTAVLTLSSPGAATHLQVVGKVRGTNGATALEGRWRINNDSGATSYWSDIGNSNQARACTWAGAGSAAGRFNSFLMHFPRAFSTDARKMGFGMEMRDDGGAQGAAVRWLIWTPSVGAAITEVDIFTTAGSIDVGSEFWAYAY